MIRIQKRVTANSTNARLKWFCDECGVLCDARGAIYLKWAEMQKAVERLDAWETFDFVQRRDATGEDGSFSGYAVKFSDMPDAEEGKWSVGCEQHVQEDGGAYWFALDRADTVFKILDWTAHLSSKNWVEHTDWNDVIRLVSRAGTTDRQP